MTKRYTSCCDRMCGADDCRNCHPGNFVEGVFVDDIPDEEEDETEDEDEETDE